MTMKAGKSSARAGVLPRVKVRALIFLKVSSSVAIPRISSTRFIRGTGFMKCMPMNWPGRSVLEARRVMEIEEVLEQITASGFRTGQSSWKIFFLISSCSVTDSMTASASLQSARLVAVAMRFKAPSLSASVICSRLTWRAMFFSIETRAACRRSSLRSQSRTS